MSLFISTVLCFRLCHTDFPYGITNVPYFLNVLDTFNVLHEIINHYVTKRPSLRLFDSLFSLQRLLHGRAISNLHLRRVLTLDTSSTQAVSGDCHLATGSAVTSLDALGQCQAEC